MRPATPITIRNRAMDYANRPTPTEFPRGKQGAVTGALSRALVVLPNDEISKDEAKLQTDLNRYLVCAWLFSPEDHPFSPFMPDNEPKFRSANLVAQEWNGLWMWAGIDKVYDPIKDKEEWQVHPAFQTEAQMVLTCAIRDFRETRTQAELGYDIPFEELLKRAEQQAPSQPVEAELDPGGMVDQAIEFLGAVVTEFDPEGVDPGPFPNSQEEPIQVSIPDPVVADEWWVDA